MGKLYIEFPTHFYEVLPCRWSWLCRSEHLQTLNLCLPIVTERPPDRGTAFFLSSQCCVSDCPRGNRQIWVSPQLAYFLSVILTFQALSLDGLWWLQIYIYLFIIYLFIKMNWLLLLSSESELIWLMHFIMPEVEQNDNYFSNNLLIVPHLGSFISPSW